MPRNRSAVRLTEPRLPGITQALPVQGVLQFHDPIVDLQG